MRINLTQARRYRQQAGVTLIEAIVSMAVFGISFFSLYGGMSMGFAIIGNARENLRATQVMVEKMETIRLYSWDQINAPGFIPGNFTESYFPAGANNNQQGALSGLSYNGTVTIGNGPIGNSYSADMRRVSVAVSWTSGGHSHNRSMSTYVSRHGLQNYIY